MDSEEKGYLKLIPGYLNDELIVKLHFKYNRDIIAIIKTLPGRSGTKRAVIGTSITDILIWQNLLTHLNYLRMLITLLFTAFDDGVYEGPLENDISPARTKSTPKPITVSNPAKFYCTTSGIFRKAYTKTI